MFKKIKNIFKKHILDDILRGNFAKPFHFIKISIKHKFFGYPYSVLIETCNYCNLQCPSCTTPHHKINREKKMMSFEDYKKIIDYIKNSVHIVLLYFSNEPLLHPQLPEMIEYAHQNNLYTIISTNATLLNEKIARKLYKANLDEIMLCLDSVKKENFEEFRKGAIFETVFENIKRFCQIKKELKCKKPYLELQFILNKLNQDEVDEMKKLAKDFGVDKLHIKPFSLSAHAYTKEEMKILADKFLPNKKEYEGKVLYQVEEDVKMKKELKTCKLVDSNFVVLVDGRVVVCCYDLNAQYVYGNVLENKLSSIWKSREARFKRKAGRNRKYPLCKTCSDY